MTLTTEAQTITTVRPIAGFFDAAKTIAQTMLKRRNERLTKATIDKMAEWQRVDIGLNVAELDRSKMLMTSR